jgi:hypothetical protein
MKNRLHIPHKNGKFFCRHEWEVVENVGYNWDIHMGIRILCECKKCGKLKNRSNYLIKEVPDSKIKSNIFYE